MNGKGGIRRYSGGFQHVSLQLIMTAEGKFLYVEDDGNLRACFFHENLPTDRLLCASRQDGQWFFRINGSAAKWYDLLNKKISDIRPLEGFTVVTRELNLYNICLNGIYLDFDWEGLPCLTSVSDEENGLFRFIPENDFNLLLKAMSHKWVCGPEGRIVTIDLHKSNVREIYIGNVKVNFDQLLQALPQADKTDELLLNEDWKVWRFVRYNPLVVFEAYGEDAAAELKPALASLTENGGYDGRVFILTDNDVTLLKEAIFCPIYADNLTFFDVSESRKRHDYFPKILLLKDTALLDDYAPVLFCSSGVLFGSGICAFLARASLYRKIESLAYFYHPEFCESQEEKTSVVELLPQENASLMVVPSMRTHRLYLEGAASLFEVCVKYYPEELLRFDGQAIINYALRRIRDFSSSHLSGHVMTKCHEYAGSESEIMCFPFVQGKRSARMENFRENLAKIETAEL